MEGFMPRNTPLSRLDREAIAEVVASSPLLAKVRDVLASLEAAHEVEGNLQPGSASEGDEQAAKSDVRRGYAALDDVMMQIPSPPQSVADLAALAVIGHWLNGDREDLEGRVAGRLNDAVLAWAGLDPVEPQAVQRQRDT
jgi:hypothetical protein